MSSENPNPDPDGGSSAPRNILDFPNEMLIKIFADFESLKATDHRVFGMHQTDDEKKLAEESRQTIARVRLVCRKFHETGSQYLLPIVVVELNQESLDRVAEISRSPAIASGIRGVRVVVNCHLDMPTLSLELFLEYKTYLIEYNNRGHSRLRLWDAIALSKQTPESPEIAELQRFMLAAQDEYQRRYEEQIELVTDGSFTSQLVASIRRMPRFTSLEFVNFRSSAPDIDTCSMPDECYQFLAEGDTWEHIERMPEEWDMELDSEIAPVVLFIDLPVAIHKEEVILREMHIRCFPTLYHNIRLLYSANGEHELCTACSHLRHVTIGEVPYLHDVGKHPVSPLPEPAVFVALSSLEPYLRAVLSGPHLKTVRLNPHSFSDDIGEISCPDSCLQDQVDGETFFFDAVLDRLEILS